MKKDKPLNNKTPLWFKEWHLEHYRPTRDRTLTNQRLIYIMLAAIIASAIASNGNFDFFGRIIRACIGG